VATHAAAVPAASQLPRAGLRFPDFVQQIADSRVLRSERENLGCQIVRRGRKANSATSRARSTGCVRTARSVSAIGSSSDNTARTCSFTAAGKMNHLCAGAVPYSQDDWCCRKPGAELGDPKPESGPVPSWGGDIERQDALNRDFGQRECAYVGDALVPIIRRTEQDDRQGEVGGTGRHDQLRKGVRE
jgi:hypothetical protein